MKAWAFILLAACGLESIQPTGKYRETPEAAIQDHVSVAEVDKGIEALAFAFDLAGLMERDRVLELVTSHELLIYARPGPWTEDGKKLAGIFRPPQRIELAWTPDQCFASTSLQHEVTHAVLCEIDTGCDTDHLLKAWWDAQGLAQVAWAARLCR